MRMADIIQRGEDGLPITTEKELAAMEKLFSDERYQIKVPSRFLRSARKGFVNPEFITRRLEEFVRRVCAFRNAARNMVPAGASGPFFDALRAKNPAAEGIINMALSIEIKSLSEMLNKLQLSARSITIAKLQPFVKTLYKPLIRAYYLDPEYATSCLMDAYRLAADRFAPSSGTEALRSATISAVQELKYIYEKIFPAMYPLVLRMTSPIMLTEHDLFYRNGSKVLGWLGVESDEILFPVEEGAEPSAESEEEDEEEEEQPQVTESVSEGLKMLEQLFPEAGWEKILEFPEESSDFAPYFAKTLHLSDAFVQLSPEHPLHFAMLLFMILSELFQGLRHVDFNARSGDEDIYDILDDWISYGENVFDKVFGGDLKSYTHQAYSQPNFGRTSYAGRLASSMHSLIRQYFLPFYDMSPYPFKKIVVDRLLPFYTRVSALREMLDECLMPRSVESALSEAKNISSLYHFDVPNVASRHLDAICGRSRSRRRTNEALIRCCASILAVLDWWINDIDSPAYRAQPKLIYRTVPGESHAPAFAIEVRKDTEEIFKKSLRRAPS